MDVWFAVEFAEYKRLSDFLIECHDIIPLIGPLSFHVEEVSVGVVRTPKAA